MAIAIENANYYQQVRSFNENLRKEIAVATSKLRGSNRKLQKFDEAKDEFISMASHQLRTPLTSIKGYLSMVLDGDSGKISVTQRHFLSEAYQSSNNMLRIINDLLSVSRIQTGKFVLDKTNEDLAEIVRHEAGELVDQAVARGLKVAVQVDEGDYTVNIDELKVRQAIDNIIDNALYYSDDGDTITVRLSREPKKIIFKVVDTGIGVPKTEISKLFTKFSRASNARKRRPDGTGVGLFLVKRVATVHGGGVIVQSKEGEGSTFGFWLPK
jgi:signal transduction histidine kinase